MCSHVFVKFTKVISVSANTSVSFQCSFSPRVQMPWGTSPREVFPGAFSGFCYRKVDWEYANLTAICKDHLEQINKTSKTVEISDLNLYEEYPLLSSLLIKLQENSDED